MKEQPNVILVLTDDQGYGDIARHGNPVVKTPNLDELHDQSVRLADYHVSPMCAPTRAAIMTGRYAARTGVWSTLTGRYILRRDEVTMADVFAASGYRTGIFGKWHLGDNYPYRPQDRGFHKTLTFGGGVVGEIPDFWDNDYFNATYMRNGTPEKFGKYCTDMWFDEAIKFIESNVGSPTARNSEMDGCRVADCEDSPPRSPAFPQRERPFFCYLPTNAPHGPFNVHDKYSEPYLQQGIKSRRAKFYGMITNIDENIGRLRQRLGELDLEDNTILIFMGDNGTSGGAGIDRKGFLRDGFNAGMRGQKCWAYEGGHRNACFIRWPGGGIEGGRDVTPVTAHLDMLPTLIHLCGLDAPDSVNFDGANIAPLLKGENADWPERVLFAQNQQLDHPEKYREFQVMTDGWRLVMTDRWRQPARPELFDIKTDPGQENDIADRHPQTVQALLKAYDGWWEGISRRFDEYCEIVIGSDRQNPTMLTAHSWHGEKGIYNQWHVRPGVQDNGFWAVEVERDGLYEFALRRWPEEVNKPIRASLPARTGVPFVDDFLPGKAINVTSARLRIADVDETKPVQEEDCAAVFRVRLEAGSAHLQTWFTDDQGESRGAYYVYTRRL